ncbi:FIG00554584: hypothetical protein [Cronobacter condimenti 1330]|uniref:Uncharacterized protein n=1 Tax=Cronobacter condimenti 1330 TaxID=1073999 RepID=K8AE82_9ENTR|nr:FIG00554584: hypothetical protein [Cronobacter condimenti 1330]
MSSCFFHLTIEEKAPGITLPEERKVYHRITNMEHKHGVESAR